jgi:hypothetical protein
MNRVALRPGNPGTNEETAEKRNVLHTRHRCPKYWSCRNTYAFTDRFPVVAFGSPPTNRVQHALQGISY